MARLKKFPKGLKARIAKEERKAIQKKKSADRVREIETAKKKLAALQKKNRGF